MRASIFLLVGGAMLASCVATSGNLQSDTIETHAAMVDWINPATMVIAEVVDSAKSETEGLDPALMDDHAWKKLLSAAQSLEYSSQRMAIAKTLRVGNHTAEVPGFANRAEIEAKLDADPVWFRTLSGKMASDAAELAKAAKRRDLRLTRDLALNLNDSCQTCHTRFWTKPIAE